MNANTPPTSHTGNDNVTWPASAMLGYGTFGCKTPVGRRYHVRSSLALAAMAILWPAAGSLSARFPDAPLQLLHALIPGAAFAYIAWEFRRYLLALDELARRIQLEAIAWTYLTGMVIAALVGGLLMAYGWRWNGSWLNPFWFIVTLEPVRGGVLYFVSRRY